MAESATQRQESASQQLSLAAVESRQTLNLGMAAAAASGKSGNSSMNGRYVPWLVKRALKQLSNDSHRCRIEVVTNCSGVVEVVLSKRELATVPPEIFDFTALETLRLDKNCLQMLDASIGRLRSLKSLQMANNQLASLPASLSNCRKLAELDLTGNKFNAIQACIFQLKRLTALHMAWNQLTALPRDISRLKMLKVLDLEGNTLASEQTLPNELVLLDHLRILNIGDNGFVTLPTVVCLLEKLQALSLSRNKLTDLPPSFSKLKYLTELSLAGNAFSFVPSSVCEIRSLKFLDVSYNSLRVLSSNVGQLHRLRILLASNNVLVAVADTLTNNLQVLDLSYNRLRLVSVARFENLTDLNVSHNRLEMLPMGILGTGKSGSGCHRLARLNVASNRIIRLPVNEIVGLNHLELFDISGNSIRHIPSQVTYFLQSKVKEYCLEANPLTSNRQAACRHSQRYHQRQSEEQVEARTSVVALTSAAISTTALGPSSFADDYYNSAAIPLDQQEGAATENHPDSAPIYSNSIRVESDASRRLIGVGTAGGLFRLDFSSTIAARGTDELDGCNIVKLFVPPQALAHSINLSVKFLKIDPLLLSNICTELGIGCIVSFEGFISIRPLPFLAGSVQSSASATALNRLYEDLTLTVRLSPRAEAALGTTPTPDNNELARSKACSHIHILDVQAMTASTFSAGFYGSEYDDEELRRPVICAPHQRVRMSSDGQHVVLKYGRFDTGVAIVIANTSNRRKVCHSVEQLICRLGWNISDQQT